MTDRREALWHAIKKYAWEARSVDTREKAAKDVDDAIEDLISDAQLMVVEDEP